MPGVNVHTATRSGPAASSGADGGRYFVAGLLERGPTDTAKRIRSLAELEATYGGRVAYGSVYDDVRTFFEEGGAEAYVLRVVGASATKGTLVLKDSSGGAGVNTLTITALGAGAASASTTVTVADSPTAGAYKITVANSGTGGGTETYDQLVTPADAVEALRASRFVRATDAASVTAAPAAGTRGGNQPVNVAAVALSAGSDDRASVTATTIGNALSLFGPELGAGAVAIPGYPATATTALLKAHAKTTNRIALVAPAVGTTDTSAISQAAGLLAGDGEFVGYFYPWVRIPSGGSTTKLVSPEGYVAAMRARAHRDLGPWAAPAGERAVASFVLEPEVKLTTAQANALDEAGVSAIRSIAGTTRLYGWRSLSSDLANYALLVGRDVLNVLAVEGAKRLEPYVFRTIDGRGQLLGEVAGTLKGLVEPMRAAGGLYERVIDGKTIDAGYSIDVGPTVNTLDSLALNTVKAVLAVRVSPVGTLIDLTIVKAGLTATV